MGGRGPAPRRGAAQRAGLNPGRRPAPPPGPKLRRLAPDARPPRWLDPVARRRWREVVPLLAAAGAVSEADTALVIRYCDCWSRWVRTARYLREHGEIYEMPFAGHTRPAPRPEVRVYEAAMRECRALEVELGLTPAARGRVSELPADDAGSLVDRLRSFAGGRADGDGAG